MLTLKAGCKVNLFLKIVGLRSDGYHLLDSLFCPIANPHDTLTFTPMPPKHGLSVSCNIEHIDIKNNSLTAAYEAFNKISLMPIGVHVHLQKNIPHGAGLGGGSSDAACVLKWCNENAKKSLSQSQLHEVAITIGADVPFFLQNSMARIKGIGEIIEPVQNFLKEKSVLLVCPPIHISTPKAYAAWDEAQKNIFSSQDLTKVAYKDKHTFSCASNFVQEHGNDFEPVIFSQYPKLATIKDELINAGAEIAVMSGSGSTMVGVFANHQQANKTAKSMEHKGYKVFLSAL